MTMDMLTLGTTSSPEPPGEVLPYALGNLPGETHPPPGPAHHPHCPPCLQPLAASQAPPLPGPNTLQTSLGSHKSLHPFPPDSGVPL